MFNLDQLRPGSILRASIRPQQTPEQTRPTSTSALDHVLGTDPSLLRRLLLPCSSRSRRSQTVGSRSCGWYLLLQFQLQGDLYDFLRGGIYNQRQIFRQDCCRNPHSSEYHLFQRYIHQILWHRSSLRHNYAFLVREGVSDKSSYCTRSKDSATLLLVEHLLLGSDSSPF